MAERRRAISGDPIRRTKDHHALDGSWLTGVRPPGERQLWDMPVHVWSLVLWFSGALVADLATFLTPDSSLQPIWPRIVGAAFALTAITAMVTLRSRTPTWFIHVQLAASVLFVVWFTHSAPSTTEALTAMIIMVVIGGYTAYTLPRVQAIAYVSTTAAGILVALHFAGFLRTLFLPWAMLTAICLAQVLILGAIVADLKRQVVIDPLTGLLNRTGLDYVTSRPGAHSNLDLPRAILVMDLDDFKETNDQHGHAAGDHVLKHVGQMILRLSRRDDIAVRSGGDEFILVLPDTDEPSAAALANRLMTEITSPVSIGIAAWEVDEDLHHAIVRADHRMYQDKARRKATGTS